MSPPLSADPRRHLDKLRCNELDDARIPVEIQSEFSAEIKEIVRIEIVRRIVVGSGGSSCPDEVLDDNVEVAMSFFWKSASKDLKETQLLSEGLLTGLDQVLFDGCFDRTQSTIIEVGIVGTTRRHPFP